MKDYDIEYLEKVFDEIGAWPQDQVSTTYFVDGKEFEINDSEDIDFDINEDNISVETNFFEEDDSIFYQIKSNNKIALFTEFVDGDPKVQISLNPDDIINLLHLNDK